LTRAQYDFSLQLRERSHTHDERKTTTIYCACRVFSSPAIAMLIKHHNYLYTDASNLNKKKQAGNLHPTHPKAKQYYKDIHFIFLNTQKKLKKGANGNLPAVP
jgi:hypothetical protein